MKNLFKTLNVFAEGGGGPSLTVVKGGKGNPSKTSGAGLRAKMGKVKRNRRGRPSKSKTT